MRKHCVPKSKAKSKLRKVVSETIRTWVSGIWFVKMKAILDTLLCADQRLNVDDFEHFSRTSAVLTWPCASHDANLLLGLDGEGHFLKDQRKVFSVSHFCILKGYFSLLGPVRGRSLVLDSRRCFQRQSLRKEWVLQILVAQQSLPESKKRASIAAKAVATMYERICCQ